MTQAQRALLQRVLASPHFAQANSLQRILQYLCDHSTAKDPGSLKEYAIALSALGRPSSFDPKIDPIIRVSIAGIRDRLRAYFENDGREEPLRLSIPKGEYRVVFSTAEIGKPGAHRAPEKNPALKSFWAPYRDPQAANLLVYTELLFFRDSGGNYLRNIFVNQLPEGAEEIKRRMTLASDQELRPSYHFLSAGEVYCAFSFIRLFQMLEMPLEMKNSRFSSWNDLQGRNLVLLGSARTNPFSASLQSGGNFVMQVDRIDNLAPENGEAAYYQGRRHAEGKLERLSEYALVTRRSGLTPNSSITMIAANHGRAIEGAGQFLALEEKVQGLLKRIGTPAGEPLPEHFQVLLRVDMIDFDEEVIHVEYVAHRILPPTAA